MILHHFGRQGQKKRWTKLLLKNSEQEMPEFVAPSSDKV